MNALRCAVLLFGCVVTTAGGDRPTRSMWVWNSSEVLASRESQDALLDFCRGHGITALWMQVATSAPGGGARELTEAPAWRRLLTDAHQRGITVGALDGDPLYAMKAFHHIPIATADAVLAFNRSSAPEARFDGLHYDIEPYLLPAWHTKASRERLLHDFLTLTAEIQRRVDAASPDMRYAIDLPFWWHHRDQATGEAIAAVTFDGRRQSASEHALGIVDRVVLMNYRNFAEGPDGMIAFAGGLLEAAERVGHATVSVGVETIVLAPQRVWFALGDGGTGVADGTSDAAIPREARIFVFADGQRLNAGVAIGAAEDVGGPVPPRLLELARAFGTRRSAASAMRVPEAAKVFETDPEWKDARAAAITDPATGTVYDGLVATYVPSPKSTFATNPSAFDRELTIVEQAFGKFTKYGGIAIHDSEGYRTLVNGLKIR